MTAESLARIFYLPAPPAKVSAPPVVEIPEEEISTPPDRLRFQYVGKVGTREGVRFYMKELKSNRIITVPSNGWQLLEQTDTSIRFGYNESVYEVPLLWKKMVNSSVMYTDFVLQDKRNADQTQ